MRRLRQRESDALTREFAGYVGRLVALARSRLREKVRHQVGEDAVVQSAVASLVEKHGGDTVDLARPDGLWDLLAESTLRHCDRWNKRYRARKRAAPEVPLAGAG